jgi:Chaperone of endosialidase
MFNSKFGVGVLKHPGYNGKDSAPPPPDYTGAANATAAGNLEAARATSAANKVNQVTPYGNLTYSINGKDSYGNDLYTATQTLSPSQQAILNQQNKLNQGLLGTANTGLNYANDILSKPGVDTSKLAQVGINPGENYSDAIMRRLAPQIQQESEQSDAQLANQGIAPGTEAYANAKRQLAQNQNDRQVAAITGGMNVGLNANQQGFQQQAYNQMQPINVINALRTGSQVSNPNFVNVPQQANTAGADILGATQQGYNAQLGATNANNAASGNFMSGLMGLGGAIFSDRRLKKNIKKIGEYTNGLGLYIYDYVWGQPSVGVMADEVEAIMPEAVIMTASGFKAVNYDML